MRRTASVIAIFLFCMPWCGSCQPAATPQAAFSWQRAAPESQGYSRARLEALRAWPKTEPTTALMVIVHGKVVFEYGDVTKVSKIASVRKSLMAMMMGKYVISGKLDINKTVVELGLDDKQPFLPLEKKATLDQLITGRSGIYMDERTSEMDSQAPNRGVMLPGTYFFYNNWEFDAAGTALEKATGKDIYDLLGTDLAQPLGMQDFHRELQKKAPSPGSVHPEYAMFFSTRDLARVGLLMLQLGQWDGKQLIPWDWVKYSTSIVTRWDEMNPQVLKLAGAPERWGFGAGWWVWDAAPFPGPLYVAPFQAAYSAQGSGGQFIGVYPARDMVIVHKVDLETHPDMRDWLSPQEWDAIQNMVFAAGCNGKCS